VKYACRGNTAWTVQLVAGGYFQGEGGVSLALEPTHPYTPHISYGIPWGIFDLKHAYLSGTAWMSGTWVHETVDSKGMVGFASSLALEPARPYTPHISYLGNDSLKHAWLSGTTWLSETVDNMGSVGHYSSMALAPTHPYLPHISYRDATNKDLKHAWWDGTTWSSETVDSAGDVGPYTSLALDSGGKPRISYYDYTKGDLKYAWWNGTTWFSETVDSVGDVGLFTSLALDQLGCPHISYYDGTNGDLKYAYIPPVKIYLPTVMRSH
jgi:hypothetical protein